MAPTRMRLALAALLALPSLLPAAAPGAPAPIPSRTLFVAIEVAEDVRLNLEAVQDELFRSDVPVDWTPQSGFHITLAYVGTIEPAMEGALRASLRAIAADTPRFPVLYRGLGSFPFRRDHLPRVIWAQPTGSEQTLRRLRDRIVATTQAVGADPERFEFNPHVTLGRARWPPVDGDLTARLQTYVGRSFGAQMVEGFALLTGAANGKQGFYEVVERYRFPKAAREGFPSE